MKTKMLSTLVGFSALVSAGVAWTGTVIRPPENVPTLGTEGIIAAAVVLALAGAYYIARRK